MATSLSIVLGALIASILLIIVVTLLYERRVSRLRLQIEGERLNMQKTAQDLAQKLFSQWSDASLRSIEAKITETVKRDYEVQLESWKKQEEKKIREDAVQKSINTLLGKIGEEFSPVLLSNRFGINLKDFRHLGTPVDFIAFKGLSDDSENVEILFLEIKSGKNSSLVERERKVRDAVASGRVAYKVVNINDIVGTFKEEVGKLSQDVL